MFVGFWQRLFITFVGVCLGNKLKTDAFKCANDISC